MQKAADDERFESEIPQEIVDQVKAILDPEDIAEVIRDRKLIAKKARGRWELVVSACYYIRARRYSIRGVIPFMASLLDSWQGGIPAHIRTILSPPKPAELPKPPAPTKEQLERRAWWLDYYAKTKERNLAKSAG